ncbi:MAG: TRAP transporter large permease subunit [Lawsonibacter sp.]|nr:TRAP transporter large permease subunit [Lawsonibacter sp.]
MSPVTITMLITVLMAVLFLTGKFPFGLITMGCCVLLVLTGVLSVSEAMSGLSNQTIVMVATMFGLSAALQRTDLAFRLKGMLSAMSGKKDMALVVVLFAIYFVMLLIMPGIVAMALIIGFLDALPDTGEVTPSRIIMPLLMFNVVWEGTMPVGMGATIDFTTNAYMESIVGPDQLLQFLNTFSVKIVPALLMIPFCLIIWKVFPKKKLNLKDMQTKEMTQSDLPQWKQNFIYISFILVIVVLVLNKVAFFGKIMWIFPAACLLAMGFAGVMTPRELTLAVGSDTVWMLAGIMGVTAALTNTGAAQIIGNWLLALISWTDNSWMILFIVCLFTAVMTTFLSNSGVKSVLTPLVAAMAVAGNMDPRGIVIVITVASGFSFCFPTGSTTCALAYASGEYNPFKIMHITIPLLILLCLVTATVANFMFPVWG